MDNEKEKIAIGRLFDSIDYYTKDDLDNFSSKMNKEQALFCLIESVKCAYARGIYSMEETEVLSRALRTLSNE